MTTPAPFGLLLDVDGPVASPIDRRIVIDSIVDDLLTLAAAGIPIAFITGRSDAFMREQVVARLVAGGLDARAHVFGVFEKGGCWAPVTPHGLGELEIDHTLAIPASVRDAVEGLARERYADTMFVDEAKHVMISLEASVDVTPAEYQAAQSRFQDEVFALMSGLDLGVRYGDREHPDAAGEVPWRIDPTIISTDVESVHLDKDRGADRALDWFAARGVTAERWWSAGDSRSDYRMADAVHARGIPVTHLDVRPADGMLDREFEVATEPGLVNDAAGAAFLHRRVAQLG
jgi:phosphoglycolate phosphatase-like HAD superfamily hydrolase